MRDAQKRTAALALLDWATCGTAGVSENHPRYQLVTECRDVGRWQRSYSSCADLGHWLLWRLGCREGWCNREERTRGPGDWRSQVNLNWLCPPPVGRCGPAMRAFDKRTCGAGDIVVMSTKFGGHVACVLDITPTELITADYGQPGGCVRRRELTPEFTRSIFSHLRLTDVPLTAPPDLTCLDLTGEEIDALAGLIPE